MITTIILCAVTSIITALAVGTILRKGGAASEDPPIDTPFPPLDLDTK